MSSNPLLSPLGAIPVSSHELGESPPLRYPRHLIILASLLMALESSLMIAGFVLGFEQIQKSGHLIDFTWREYLVQSIYHCLSFPSSLFDLAGISVLKAIFLTTLLLICRFNYRIRRQKGPRYAVYGILVLSLIYGIRKATLMITLVTEPVELPVPFEWTAIVLGVFMAFTVIQISVAVPFLGMWLKALERDLGDAVPPTPRETEDDAEPEIKWRIIYRQLGLLKPDIWILLIGFTALVLNSLSQLAIPWLIGRVVDAAVFSGRDPDGLHNRLYYLATIFVLGGITGFIRTYCFTMTGFRLVTRLRKDLFDALTVQDMSFFDGKTAEELLTIMSVSCQSMQTALTTSLSLGLRFLFQAVGSTILLLSISWKLTLILFSCVPLFVLGSVVYGHYIRSVEERYQDEGQKQVHETLTHIRSVRALGAEPYVQSRYKLTLQEMYTAGRSVTATHATFMGLTGILPPLSLTLLLYFGLYSLGQGEQSPGSLVSFFLYMLTLILAFGVLGGLYGDIVSGYAAGLQVLKILDRVPCIVLTGSGSGIVKTEWTGRVTLESVSFAYPTRPEVLVLKDINLELAPGSLTVLVGDSGAGKSSILYLIARLYDVAHGRLVMDSKLDVRLASQQWFRPLIGFFLPEEDSFTGKTIYDHILFGYEENIKHLIPQEIVERAAQLANIHSFIMSLPQGYDTRPDRLILSASQKKRLRLARLLIRNPQIVLIDFGNRADEEETDEDREAWRIAIRQISQEQKTVVLVSHDKEILGSADKVVFLSNGSVVESGTHDSLSARQGPYAAFLQGQL